MSKKDQQEPQVLVERKQNVATITLNRPRKKNAITKGMYKTITTSLKELSSDSTVKVILITGSGDYFSAGNDLSNFSTIQHPLSMAKEARDVCYEFVDSFISCDKLIVVAVNGPAIGIATTLLGLCDEVFASSSATFRTPFAELAQAPEGCSSYLFPKIMGAKIADEVLAGGKLLSAEDALSCGLIQHIYPPNQVQEEAIKHCTRLATHPLGSDCLERKLVKQGLRATLKKVNTEEVDYLQKAWVSTECFMALAKYLESRKMRAAAMVLRTANFLGPLWGQPNRNGGNKSWSDSLLTAVMVILFAIVCALIIRYSHIVT